MFTIIVITMMVMMATIMVVTVVMAAIISWELTMHQPFSYKLYMYQLLQSLP